MKRFWLFIYQDYEERGGMRDFVMDFDSPEEAKEYYDSIPEDKRKLWDNCQIFDSDTKEVFIHREWGVTGKLSTFNLSDIDWWEENVNN